MLGLLVALSLITAPPVGATEIEYTHVVYATPADDEPLYTYEEELTIDPAHGRRLEIGDDHIIVDSIRDGARRWQHGHVDAYNGKDGALRFERLFFPQRRHVDIDGYRHIWSFDAEGNATGYRRLKMVSEHVGINEASATLTAPDRWEWTEAGRRHVIVIKELTTGPSRDITRIE